MTDMQMIGTIFLKLWWLFVGCGIGAVYARHLIKSMELVHEYLGGNNDH